MNCLIIKSRRRLSEEDQICSILLKAIASYGLMSLVLQVLLLMCLWTLLTLEFEEFFDENDIINNIKFINIHN